MLARCVDPQWYGHSIENASDTEPTRILIGFNTEHCEAIDLSAWIAGNPRYLIENNFGVSASEAETFPRDRVFIASQDGPSRQEDGYDVFPRTEPGTR